MTQSHLPPSGVSSEFFPRINPPPVHVKENTDRSARSNTTGALLSSVLLYMTLHGSADIQGKVIGPGTTFKNPKIFYTMFVRKRRR
jgi:hypothetical protein